jgi:Kef-type K+ transport system membrane component KefB
VVVTLLLVLGAAFLTDIIGINVIFGGFVCGLLIPSEGPFAGGLVDDDDDDDNP